MTRDDGDAAGWAELADAPDEEPLVDLPVLAVVGRPNVGKSTLVNRILGRREAVVQDVPGVTRDRVAYDALWAGRRFTVVDTGGWEPDARGFAGRVAAQADRAIESADAVLLVVDATVGATATDEAVARVLRRGGKPVVLAANKVDDERTEPDAAALWSLGLGEPYPVSRPARPGQRGPAGRAARGAPGGPAGPGSPARRTAPGGAGGPSQRRQVEPAQPADRGGPRGGRPGRRHHRRPGRQSCRHRFRDLAVRRHGRTAPAGQGRRRGAEYYASLRTASAIEAAEVAVVLLDASEPISEQDQRVIATVVEAGRALVLAFNKWDLLDADRRERLEKEIDRELQRVRWAPRVNVSASYRARRRAAGARAADRAGVLGAARLRPAGSTAGSARSSPPHRRRSAAAGSPGCSSPPRPAPGRRASCCSPPASWSPAYRRFVERRLREEFGFPGTPVDVSVRVRERRDRKK